MDCRLWISVCVVIGTSLALPVVSAFEPRESPAQRECDASPIAQVGSPQEHANGLRPGVYSVDCHESEPYGFESWIRLREPAGVGTQCAEIPFVGVGGVAVPGTEQTLCQATTFEREVKVETPALRPDRSILIVTPNPATRAVELDFFYQPHCEVASYPNAAKDELRSRGIDVGLVECTTPAFFRAPYS